MVDGVRGCPKYRALERQRASPQSELHRATRGLAFSEYLTSDRDLVVVG